MGNNHLVIMAGGVGSRLYPLSTEEHPKQFVDVLDCGKTLIQLTMERFQGLVPPENVWVVTATKYAHFVREQLPDVPEANILKEPMRRNTAPCIAYASWRIKSQDPKANIIVSPSDHNVRDIEEFQRVVRAAMEMAEESDTIVTLGMKPTRPDTGYGYIQINTAEPCARNAEIFPVDAFKEKPDEVTAQAYLDEGNYFWNAGIFIWSVNTIVNALRVYAPDVSQQFEPLLPLYGTDEEQTAVDKAFQASPSISVDYAVLEKADEIFCHPADFGWSDLGTWESLEEWKQQTKDIQ